MYIKLKFICAISQKAFTKNFSLKRHRTNQHMSVNFNCLTYNKQYKRRVDLVRHSKKCLAKELNNGTSHSSQTPTPNAASGIITNPHQDLTASDSDNDDDTEIIKMSKNFENNLCSKTTIL